MQSELAKIRGIVRRCGDPGFDRHVARVMVEMLASRGVPRQLLEEAMTERMRLLAEAVLECDSGADFLERAREVVAAG